MKRINSGEASFKIGHLLRGYFELEDSENPNTVRNIEKRKEAMDLLEELRVLADAECEYKAVGRWHVKPSAKFLSKTNELFVLLNKYFMPTCPPTEQDMVDELRQIIFNSDELDFTCPIWMESYNSGFAILIVRHALKYYKLPIIQASGWKLFATNYSGLVMAA